MLFFTPAAFLPVGDWWHADSEIDLDFENLRYHDAGELGTDPLAAQTVLMLHMNGADASVNFSDSTGRHFLVPVNDGELDTAQSKFGSASLFMDGTTDDRIDTYGQSGLPDDFVFDGDFTVDFWFRLANFAASTPYGLMEFRTDLSAKHFGIDVFNNGSTLDFISIEGGTGAGSFPGWTPTLGTIQTNTWYHVALTRSGDQLRLFVDGDLKNTQTNNVVLDGTSLGRPSIGNIHNNWAFDGWIDEVRVIKGAAAWTSNFTPPSAPYDVGIGPYDVLSISRASIGYAQNSAGELEAFLSNQLRITDLGLLVEDARTNQCPHSQEMSGGTWSQFNVTVSADAIAAPDGTTTADKLIASATATAHVNTNATPEGSSSTWTWSIYLKAAGYNYATLTAIADAGATRRFINIDLVNGTITDSQSTGSPTVVAETVETLGNGWVRARITLSSAALSHFEFGISNSATPTWNADGVTFTGDGSSGVYAWGAQVEEGSFPSSYIPTTGGSATRAADAVTCISALQTELEDGDASIMCDVTYLAAPDSYRTLLGSTSSSNPAALTSNSASDTGISHFSNVNELAATIGNALTLSGGVKVASAWNEADPGRSVVGGGGTVATDTSADNLSPVGPLVGSHGVVRWFFHIRRLTAWSTRLADATLQSLTAP